MRRIFGSLLALLLVLPLSAQEGGAAKPLTLTSGLELYEPRADASPEELEVYAAYEEARQLEAEIVQMYREIRAAELTMVQRQTLKRSLESTLMPLSDRADVDREVLTSKADSAEAVEKYQKELSVVMQETNAIVSNAQDLLESLLDEEEPTTSTRKEEKEEKEKAEEQEQKEEQEQQEQKEEQLSKEEKEKREKEKKEKREKKEKEAKEELEKAEMHLEKALEEIKAAREEVAKEKQEAEEKLEKKEPEEAKEAKEAREKLKRLEELEEKIDVAEEAVEAVVEKVKAMEEVAEVEVEEAEEAVEAMREAMAAVKAANATAEKEAKAEAKEKTAEAVRQMEAANSSLEAASKAIESLNEASNGDGGSGSNIAQIQALAELAQAGSGTWLDLTAQMRNEDLEITPGEPPLEARPELWAEIEELEAAPTARKFSATTPKDLWIFIGDWYVLSRYDNEGRSNIEKVYPPESIVDLNAQYLSEDGKTLRWEYESYLPPMISPYAWESWKIYYFYTELMFEEETEAWIAIGSDDRSDLWINDLPVWHSANRHKGWYPAEGFRKVVFRKGRNKVLLRLENGQASMGFSLYLNLPSD